MLSPVKTGGAELRRFFWRLSRILGAFLLAAILNVSNGVYAADPPEQAAGKADALTQDDFAFRWYGLFTPCEGRCAVSIYNGSYVKDGMYQIFTEAHPPHTWDYDNDFIVAGAASKRILSLWDMVHVEPEVGIARRYGQQHVTEVWLAAYLRFDGFPWREYLYTSVAVSTGINYADKITPVEEARGGKAGGDRLLHYLAPEITFALPEYEHIQLMFRFHHRSGAYGFISDTDGGAHYGTVGLRVWF
ncbi:hypothetical protein PUV47_13190 [Pseudovibrio exalbescens]|uniref:hypothetical protein n=1 Tax=Pseudovibrio exalbescens TaxID=197461 RepID=UPI002365E620|nr:hypothetical protein [Pseudovibrio exalbescens]MDD7910876.1 hypothetical protein [Pseudovibrio exalbescens]